MKGDKAVLCAPSHCVVDETLVVMETSSVALPLARHVRSQTVLRAALKRVFAKQTPNPPLQNHYKPLQITTFMTPTRIPEDLANRL